MATPRRVVVVKKGEGSGVPAGGDSRRDERSESRRPEKSWEPRKPSRDDDDGMTYNPFAELLKNREKTDKKKK